MLTNFPNSFPDSNDVPSEGQERLIVELDSDYNPQSCETPKVKIWFQKWATGIGWFNQKSLSLTLDQAAFLQQEIGRATVTHKMKSSQSRPVAQPQAGPVPAGAGNGNKVIKFPAGKSRATPTGQASRSHSGEPTGSSTASILPFKAR